MKNAIAIFLLGVIIQSASLVDVLEESSSDSSLLVTPAVSTIAEAKTSDQATTPGSQSVVTEDSSRKLNLLPNITSPIHPFTNSTVVPSITEFLDCLASVAGSIGSGVNQAAETATGVVQGTLQNNNLTVPPILNFRPTIPTVPGVTPAANPTTPGPGLTSSTPSVPRPSIAMSTTHNSNGSTTSSGANTTTSPDSTSASSDVTTSTDAVPTTPAATTHGATATTYGPTATTYGPTTTTYEPTAASEGQTGTATNSPAPKSEGSTLPPTITTSN